ncbi:MAG: O-antigen ligase family protein [Candidatus Falkowbacteria bacterium]
MPLKMYKLILKIGVLATFVSWFLIFSGWYFPYITGKQIYFNIVVELLMIFWVAMIVKFPETRPKKSWISFGIGAYVLAMLASSIFGVDWNLSFWGDAERMLGLFDLLHFFALYLLISSAFTTKRDWYVLFNGAIVAALALAFYAFAKYDGGHSVGNVNMTSNISTLGNATYVAGVMLFAFWFVVYMLIKTKDWLIRALYLVALGIIFACFMFADVSGSQAGFAVSVAVFGFIWGFWNKNKRARKITLGILGVFLAFVIVMFAVRDNAVFNGTRLGKVFRDFSENNPTLNTRFYAWNAAIKGFQEMPILGSGYNNFALFFDKYFQGSYYKWTTTEEYFDHAHNNLLDIASTSGIIGLITYLSIFIAIAYYAIKAWRQGKIGLTEFAFITAVFVAYFIHNLAVFDAMANLMLLMIVFGYVYWLHSEAQVAPEPDANLYVTVKIKQRSDNMPRRRIDEAWEFSNRELIALAIAACFFGFLIFHYNMRIARAFRESIDAIQTWQSGDVQVVHDAWQQALSYDTPLDRDLRSLFIGQVVGNFQALQAAKGQERDQLWQLAVEMSKKNVVLNPKDSMANLWMAQVYYYKGVMEKNMDDIKQALVYIDASTANGGQHIPPMIFKSSVQSSLGDRAGALKTLRTALEWYPNYYDAYCYVADITVGDRVDFSPAALVDLTKCLDNSPKARLLKDDLWSMAANSYRAAKDYKHTAMALGVRLLGNPKDAVLRAQAVDYYNKAGMTAEAQKLVEDGNDLQAQTQQQTQVQSQPMKSSR